MGAKSCSRCGATKPATDFNINKTTSSGLTSHCKVCARVQPDENSKNRKPEFAWWKDKIRSFKAQLSSRLAICIALNILPDTRSRIVGMSGDRLQHIYECEDFCLLDCPVPMPDSKP